MWWKRGVNLWDVRLCQFFLVFGKGVQLLGFFFFSPQLTLLMIVFWHGELLLNFWKSLGKNNAVNTTNEDLLSGSHILAVHNYISQTKHASS